MLLEWLTPSTLSNDIFKPLLPQRIPDEKQPVVISHSGKPQALCFVGEDQSSGKLECEGLKFLDPTMGGDLLNFLFTALLEHAALKKCHTVFFYFDEKSTEAPAIQNALLRHKWSQPELYIMSCYFDRSFDPPWLHANFRIPQQFSFAPWRKMSAEQLLALRVKERNSVFPSTLSPFKYPDNDLDYSLGLIHDDEIIGWVMTRRINPHLLSYSTIFVQSEFKMMGLAIPMMAESIKNIMHSTIPGAIIDTYVTLSEPYWVDFVNKRLKPYSRTVTNIFRSYKRVAEK